MTPRALSASPLSDQSTWNRFWAKVEVADCWEWTASRGKHGYGVLWFWVDGKSVGVGAHRLAWEALIGPIPDGLHIDHLCRNRACCNPDHLQPVTQAENNRRGFAGTVNRARITAATHCKRGHPYDPDNLVERRGRNRECLACRRERYKEKQDGRRPAHPHSLG